eukprot:4466863-Pleurochrysis_carterae.AAC.8
MRACVRVYANLACMLVCACACARARACVRVRACACVRARACLRVRACVRAKPRACVAVHVGVRLCVYALRRCSLSVRPGCVSSTPRSNCTHRCRNQGYGEFACWTCGFRDHCARARVRRKRDASFSRSAKALLALALGSSCRREWIHAVVTDLET